VEGAFRQGLLAAPDTRLIETLLWDGAAFPRLALHLARLEVSAVRLGFACDRAAVLAALHASVGPAPRRVRLTLGADGGPAVETAPLPAAKAVWRLGLAAERLDAADPWLGVKSTRRAAYDRARAALPPGLDEVVFFNAQGEVCDGTITTLFFDRGAGTRTPPLSSGLLPGVLRAELGVPEEVLAAADLPGVRLWVGNALRGLMRAEWAGESGQAPTYPR
jgi:4-amino-4-deoxychorismate lyase